MRIVRDIWNHTSNLEAARSFFSPIEKPLKQLGAAWDVHCIALHCDMTTAN